MESEEWTLIDLDMGTLIELDVAWDCTVRDFFLGIEKYGASIIEIKAEGPGGGNPSVRLLFKLRSQAQDYLSEFYGEDTDLDRYLVNS